MINNQKSHIIKIFVFGTLLKGQRFDFYMGGSTYGGKYYTRGQLMMAERINHLESRSGEFPKGYDLTLIPTWSIEKNGDFNFDLDKSELCFYYRRRNEPIKILGGDYSKHKDPVEEIGVYLGNEKMKILTPEDVVNCVKQDMRIDF